MAKLLNLSIMTMSLFAGTSVMAMPIQPGISPADYGAFVNKSAPAQSKASVARSAKKAKSKPNKVQAYANEGNAEVEKIGTLTLLEQEDFSKLTTGSEEAPDLKTQLEIQQWMIDPKTGEIARDENDNPIPNPDYEYPWNNMKKEFISGSKGWGVGNAYSAGGMLYFPFSESDPQGKISTPWIDLSANNGTFVLEFKVKVTKEALNADMPPAIIVETAETNNMSPTWDMFEETFVNFQNLSTEWTTFRLVYQGAGPSTLCNIVGQGVAGGMFIDDVRLYSLRPFLATPVPRLHSDFTEESFVLNWSPVEGAEGYIVNVWYDDIYGNRVNHIENATTSNPYYKVVDTNLDDIYFYKVQAVNSQHRSLETMPREIFDIITPEMRAAKLVDPKTRLFSGGVKEVVSAFGYNYYASARRVAEKEGPFTVTDEQFTGWAHPLYEDGWNYTKENPVDDKIATMYYPTDINQQGWQGKYFMIYKDYLCLCPFFYEASYHRDQSCWLSPEFDLSKDNGNISVSLKLAGAYDYSYDNYASCAIALFNWNDEKGDYEQVDLAYCKDLNFDWQNRSVTLKNGSKRSVIGFFAVGSYGDLYIDDIKISQNYKAGESFDDPFYFSTWQLAEILPDPTEFEFEIPDRALGSDIHQRAQAVRIHVDANGAYDGEKASPFAAYDFVTKATSGLSLVEGFHNWSVSVTDGEVNILNPEGLNVSLVSIDGTKVDLGNSSQIKYRPGSKGVYIITVGSETTKLSI